MLLRSLFFSDVREARESPQRESNTAAATVRHGVSTAVSRPRVPHPPTTYLWSSPGQVNAVILDVIRGLLFAGGEVKH